MLRTTGYWTTLRKSFIKKLAAFYMGICWPLLVRGLRHKLNLSQKQLSNAVNIPRRTLARYEEGYRIPVEKYSCRILNFTRLHGLSTKTLEKLAMSLAFEEPKSNLNLEKSEDLAEFVGILLGDGELRLDGTIRISFDPKKDKKYLKFRVFPLIKKLFCKVPTYESYKRIQFFSRDTVLFFREEYDLKPGNKVKNGLKIPNWCFDKEEDLGAALRGLLKIAEYQQFRTVG